MKLFVALGSGDIVAAHRAQMAGRSTLSETSIIFSGQLLEFCRERGIEMLALSHNPRADRLCDGPLQLENQPRRFEGWGGLAHHWARVTYAAYLALRAYRFGAELAIIDSGSAHYFALSLFRILGVPVAINFHNTLWANGFKPKERTARLIMFLDAWFFRHLAVGIIGCSPECGIQAQKLAGYELPYFEYRSQFRKEGFAQREHDSQIDPFRVIFVGRAEVSKGVLDIAHIAERLHRESQVPILFDVCGDGSALAELKHIVTERGLEGIVGIRGRLARSELLAAYARAHAVIVPTRSNFCEGLPLVCAEAVLSGLPIVTSRVSNAIPVLGPALVEAEPENIESYVAAIRLLAEDRGAYKLRRQACSGLARQFLDRSQSYPAAIDRLMAHLFQNWRTLDSYERLFARMT